MYIRNFIDPEDASVQFDRLWNDLNWERRPDAPRREYWANTFDRDYTYGSGAGVRTYKAQDWHPMMRDIGGLLAEHMGVWLEGCFLNGYEGSRDWLGWHADDDPGIDHSRAIAIVTLYSDPTKKPRSIQFRELAGTYEGKQVYNVVQDHPLEHGSLYLMPPGFQFTHQHRIPKAGFDCADRISLTFRGLL